MWKIVRASKASVLYIYRWYDMVTTTQYHNIFTISHKKNIFILPLFSIMVGSSIIFYYLILTYKELTLQ